MKIWLRIREVLYFGARVGLATTGVVGTLGLCAGFTTAGVMVVFSSVSLFMLVEYYATDPRYAKP